VLQVQGSMKIRVNYIASNKRHNTAFVPTVVFRLGSSYLRGTKRCLRKAEFGGHQQPCCNQWNHLFSIKNREVQ